jgi:hypothetical protein
VRFFYLVLLTALCGCAQQGDRNPRAQTAPAAPVAQAATVASRHAFATLPDRGELVSYRAGEVHRAGAYTWHRADLSEEHALHAIASGHLRLTTPSGKVLDVRYDRHVEHPSGDWTWIGHLAGNDGAQTILTFGAEAAFGSIAQPGQRPLRLTVRDGDSWLVETDGAKLSASDDPVAHPHKPDFHVVPRSELPYGGRGGPSGPFPSGTAFASAAMPTAAAATSTTAAPVDLIVGYTPGFASYWGGTSATTTRLNFMVEVANTAYRNSQVDMQVRLVRAMVVNYTDSNTNDLALEKVSGYKSGTGTVPTDPAFDALRAAREQYGADLVTVVRRFRKPEQGGCGIAWLLGGGLQGLQPNIGWDELGYSVVSDGTDLDEASGDNYYCRDETLAHELGHNMGLAHDRATAMGDDGVLDNPDDYGAYSYSFGYKATAAAGNFFTVMAYGESSQTPYRVFSNPRITFCGGFACGTAGDDNARTLIQTAPVVAAFRSTVSSIVPPVDIRWVVAGSGDFNGDGKDDILWRNISTGANAIWRSGNATTSQGVTSVASLAWKVAGVGDFDGDGKADIFWRNTDTGANAIWKAANSAMPQTVAAVTVRTWNVAGIGDFDSDGKSDVLWRNAATGTNAIWRSGNASTPLPISAVTNTAWKIAGVGDFDGDGHADVAWRNSASGADAIWRSANPATPLAMASVSTQAWTVAGTGDFGADGKADLLWRHGGTGVNAIWNSANVSTQQGVSTVSNLDFIVATVGDFDGDGRADILWRNTSTGANSIWKSGNSATPQAVAPARNEARL